MREKRIERWKRERKWPVMMRQRSANWRAKEEWRAERVEVEGRLTVDIRRS